MFSLPAHSNSLPHTHTYRHTYLHTQSERTHKFVILAALLIEFSVTAPGNTSSSNLASLFRIKFCTPWRQGRLFRSFLRELDGRSKPKKSRLFTEMPCRPATAWPPNKSSIRHTRGPSKMDNNTTKIIIKLGEIGFQGSFSGLFSPLLLQAHLSTYVLLCVCMPRS